MRITKAILFLITGILLFSCGNPGEKTDRTVVRKDTQETAFEKQERERLKKIKENEDQDRIDSMRMSKVLVEALEISNRNSSSDTFYREYTVTPDDEYEVKVTIHLNNHFTNSYPHLIIRRQNPMAMHIDIFVKKNNTFQKVIAHEEWSMTYVSDTIREINGDGLKDFVVNWYGATGCCLKAFSNVYILNPDKRSFAESAEFINPTFSPKEKMVRGVCYGHVGHTEIYKYKWNGSQIDTIEYISLERNNKDELTGKIIVSSRRPYNDQYKIIKRLNAVPKEYENIEGYDWFMGTGYE